MDKSLLSAGQRDYEAKRAAKAGVTLEKWLSLKEKQADAESRAKLKAAEPAKAAKPPGMIKRLIDRAHQPLQPTDPKNTQAPKGAIKGQAAPRPIAHRRQSP